MNDYNGDGVTCVMTTARASILCLATADGNPSKYIYHRNLSHSKGDSFSTDTCRLLRKMR